MATTLKSVVKSLVQSIDVINYLLKSHHRRTAVIAWYLGKSYGLSQEQLSNLVLAASLHDIGALTVGERDQLVQMDIEDPHPHARLGYYMLESFEPFEKIAKIIFYHHWPYMFDNAPVAEIGEVPIESYFIHVADRIDILIHQDTPIMLQTEEITKRITELSGTLFHPDVVQALQIVSSVDSFWLDIENMSMQQVLDSAISKEYNIELTIDLLEQLSYTFSKVIDCRSKFTVTHSYGVGAVTYEISKMVGYSEEKCRKMRVAGLLHDIGKVGVATEIVEKPGPLTERERTHMNTHAYFTNVILRNADGLDDIANWAAHHHETHDGSGYPDRFYEESITEEMDILAYADIFTALSEDRPYRKGLPIETIRDIMKGEIRSKHGNKIYDIIENEFYRIYKICQASIAESLSHYQTYQDMANRFEREVASMPARLAEII